MVGTGYVGLVSGACFSEFGHETVCVDLDANKIEELKHGVIPIYEPGLDTLVNGNAAAGRLTFTTDLAQAVAEADAVFIAVGTPTRRGDGHADLTYVYDAARQIAMAATGYTVIVTKSTVPVGTSREVARIVAEANPHVEFDVCSNPEFLREGSAINDFMRPDRVVIGCNSERALEVMTALYRPLFLNETPILNTTLETAELTKYAANAFLATKITFINEMADLCEKVGGNVQDVARGIGLDGRIGRKFLNAGPGYGGSCFPKDTLALCKTAADYEAPSRIVEAVVEVNNSRKIAMADRVLKALGSKAKGATVAVLGVTFKPNTDDMRDAPSLDVIPALQQAGCSIRAFDPVGMKEAEKLLPDVAWCRDAYDAMTDADCLVIITEWNEFRALQIDRVRELLSEPLVVDLRNIYKPDEMAEAGFTYLSIGRPTIPPTKAAGVTLVANT
tara:strand:+ start:210 stop:1550 length:1341 start_codon:yes stop_codon:yes gene_type:complete